MDKLLFKIKIFISVFVIFESISINFAQNGPLCQFPQNDDLNRDGPIIQQITGPIDHGEEPHWDADNQVLYFVDITQQNILKYNPENSEVTHLHLPGNAVTPVIPVRDQPNRFVVGVDRQLTLVEWNGQNNTYGSSQMHILSTVDQDHPTNRFNDGKADRNGRLWIGTIGHEDSSGVVPNQAALYRITGPNLSTVRKVVFPVTNSNGLAWNRNDDQFYYIDTGANAIFAFDYDAKAGTISNRRVAFNVSEHDIKGYPDGMTIDKDDNLWVALFSGGAVINVNPKTGQLLKSIAIPARDVTSTMWGGKNLDILYVTTSQRDLTPAQRAQQPAAGALFAIHNLKTSGYKPPYTVLLDSQ